MPWGEWLTHDGEGESKDVFSSPTGPCLHIKLLCVLLVCASWRPFLDRYPRLTGKKLEELSAGGSQPVPIWRVNTGSGPARQDDKTLLVSLGLNLRLAPGSAHHGDVQTLPGTARELTDLSVQLWQFVAAGAVLEPAVFPLNCLSVSQIFPLFLLAPGTVYSGGGGGAEVQAGAASLRCCWTGLTGLARLAAIFAQIGSAD